MGADRTAPGRVTPHSPVLVVLAAMVWTMTWWLVKGLPRQFMDMGVQPVSDLVPLRGP